MTDGVDSISGLPQGLAELGRQFLADRGAPESRGCRSWGRCGAPWRGCGWRVEQSTDRAGSAGGDRARPDSARDGTDLRSRDDAGAGSGSAASPRHEDHGVASRHGGPDGSHRGPAGERRAWSIAGAPFPPEQSSDGSSGHAVVAGHESAGAAIVDSGAGVARHGVAAAGPGGAVDLGAARPGRGTGPEVMLGAYRYRALARRLVRRWWVWGARLGLTAALAFTSVLTLIH